MYVQRIKVARFLSVVSQSSNAVLAREVIDNLREARDSGVQAQDNFPDLAQEFVPLTQMLRLKLRQLNGTLIESVQENIKSNAVITVATAVNLDTATSPASTEVATAAAKYFNDPTLTEAVDARVSDVVEKDIDPHLVISTTDEGDVNSDNSRTVPLPPSYEEALKGIETMADYGALPLATAAAAVENMCPVGGADISQAQLDSAKAVPHSISLIEGGASSLFVSFNPNVRARTVTDVIPLFFTPEAAAEYLATGALTMGNAKEYAAVMPQNMRTRSVSDVIQFASIHDVYAFMDAFNRQQQVSRTPRPDPTFSFHALGRQFSNVNEYEMRMVSGTARGIWNALRKVCLNKSVQDGAVTLGKGLLSNLFAKFNPAKRTDPTADKYPLSSFLSKGPDYIPVSVGVTAEQQLPFNLTSLSYLKQACEEARNIIASTVPNRQSTGIIANRANSNYRQILGLPITSIRSQLPTTFKVSRMM